MVEKADMIQSNHKIGKTTVAVKDKEELDITEEPINVLVIEDDPQDIDLLCEMLSDSEDRTFDVECANCLSDGLTCLDEGGIDVILLDLFLPDSQGIGTLARVLAKDSNVCVVVLTDPGDGDVAEEALVEGAHDFVIKGQMNDGVLPCFLAHAVARSKVQKRSGYSDNYFRALIQNAPIAILLVDSTGTMIYYSQTMDQILGFAEGENIGKSVFDFVHPDDIPPTLDKFVKLVANPGSTDKLELRARHKDGSWRYAEVVGTSHIHNPEVNGVVINFQDITVRRQTEEVLKRKWDFYQLLAEQSPDSLVVVNVDGCIIYQSPSTVGLGYKPGDVEGTISFDLVHPDDLPGVMETFGDVVQRPGGTGSIDCRAKHPDGTWHYAQVAGMNCLDNPAVEGVIVTIRDITERKKTEEMLAHYAAELSRSNEDLEQFAYVASHDLQEPLRMVGSYVQLLEKRYKEQLDSDADDFIHYAVDGVTRMQALINGLLAYSRVTTRGKEFEPVECEAVLDRVLVNLQMAVEDSGGRVTHDPLPKIMADELQLSQVFQNLIGNAIKFRDEKAPQVHVSAEKQGNEWMFSVRDNGIGFEQEYADRVFAIFKRLHRDEQYPGTGIGLSLCKKIVERHGGRIWVESEVGHGTTFYFTVPVVEDE
jgi:PAS domain S-box-containing protein